MVVRSSTTLNKLERLQLLPASASCSFSSWFGCPAGQTRATPTNSNLLIVSIPLAFVHSDVWGPSPAPSLSGYRIPFLELIHRGLVQSSFMDEVFRYKKKMTKECIGERKRMVLSSRFASL